MEMNKVLGQSHNVEFALIAIWDTDGLRFAVGKGRLRRYLKKAS